jgi:predicted urease superfamily metal-dependent hydrolase
MKCVSPNQRPDNANQTIPRLAFTREETAQAIGVHPITISRLTEQGKLRPSRATRRPLYSIEEIQRFLRDTASKPVEAGQRCTNGQSKQL